MTNLKVDPLNTPWRVLGIYKAIMELIPARYTYKQRGEEQTIKAFIFRCKDAVDTNLITRPEARQVLNDLGIRFSFPCFLDKP